MKMKYLYISFILFFMTGVSMALSSSQTGDFWDSSTWGGTVPSSNVFLFIDNDTVGFDSGSFVCTKRLTVGNTVTNDGNAAVFNLTGGSFTATSDSGIFVGSEVQRGVINQFGGSIIFNSYDSTSATGGAIRFGTGGGAYNFSGGTLTGGLIMLRAAGSIFKVSGNTDGSTIDLDYFDADYNNSTGKKIVLFKFGEDGITTIHADKLRLTGSSDIVIKGSNYTDDAGTFTLFDCAEDPLMKPDSSGEYFSSNNIRAVEFSGHTAFPEWSGNDLIVTVKKNLSFPVGVHRPNLMWFGTLEEELSLLSELNDSTGAACVRLSLREPFNDVVAHIAHCNSMGLDVCLNISPNINFLVAGAVRRPGNDMLNPAYRLSDLDTARFSNEYARFLQLCTNAGVSIKTIELFNEINWADFNGDLPAYASDSGLWKFIDYSTAWNDTDFATVRSGLIKYGQCLKIADTLTEAHLGSGTEFVMSSYAYAPQSAIAAAAGSAIDRTLATDILQGTHPNLSIATNYLQYSDGLNLHFYPRTVDISDETGMETAYNQLMDVIDPVEGILISPMPIWVTEWGYSKNIPALTVEGVAGGPCDGAKRKKQFHRFLDALEAVSLSCDIRCAVLACFDNNSDTHAIYVDGALTEEGKIFNEVCESD